MVNWVQEALSMLRYMTEQPAWWHKYTLTVLKKPRLKKHWKPSKNSRWGHNEMAPCDKTLKPNNLSLILSKGRKEPTPQNCSTTSITCTTAPPTSPLLNKLQDKKPPFLYAYLLLSAKFTVLTLKGRASPYQCFTIYYSIKKEMRGWRQLSSNLVLSVAKELHKPCLSRVQHKAIPFPASLHNF